MESEWADDDTVPFDQLLTTCVEPGDAGATCSTGRWGASVEEVYRLKINPVELTHTQLRSFHEEW